MNNLYNLFLFVVSNVILIVIIAVVYYYIFRNFSFDPLREGMTDASGNITLTSSNGVAENAATYAASLKADTIKTLDKFKISKYRADYESAILNLDDFINNLMLDTVLSVNKSNPYDSIDKLAKMQQAKAALNSAMKFVDSQ